MSARPTIEGYELRGALGAGGSGHVYEALDPTGRTVAVKVLREGADEVAAARLVREADVVRGMDHRGLIRVHDAGRTTDGRPFLAMERLEGRTLRDLAQREGGQPPARAWALMREIADALAHAHARGVLHRDLTSSNVLLDAKGRPKLTDFGLARRADDPRLSREGTSVGTPHYMAPEQWWGARVDERTDVYGLGAILYEALTGAAPWEGEESSELVHRVATGAPRPPKARGVELPPEVAAFVMRCLARRPPERPRDVAAFVQEGDAAFGRRSRPRVEPALALLAPFGLAVAMGYAGTRDPRIWLYESGYAGYTVIVAWAFAAAAALRFGWARRTLPLAPALLGALGFVTGMEMVERSVAAAPAEARFALFNVGAAEASASWFLGAVASASILCFVAALEPRERPAPPALVAAAAVVAAGGLSGLSAALSVCGLAAALLLRGAAGRPAAALAGAAAVASLAVAALVRSFGDAARLFDAELTRSARALALTELDRAHTALVFACLIALAAFVAASRWRGLAAWPRRRVALGVVAAAVIGAVLALPYAAMLERRAQLGADLERHLAVWTELDPPTGPGAAPGRLGPTLQLGRAHVSIDSDRVMLTRALDDDAGGAASVVLAQAIGRRLDASADGPELVLAADRSLSMTVVRRSLRAAYDVGVRAVDLLVIDGPPLTLPPGAPAEARVVLPTDVRAVPLRLSTEPAEAPETTFGEAAQSVVERGETTLRIGD